MRNYMTIYLAGKSFLVKTVETRKARHLQILEVKPIPVHGNSKVSIHLIQGKISLKGK